MDLFFILAMVGGTGTSLGLATPMLAAVAARLLGIDESFALTLVISAVCVLLFAVSVYLGLERGIRRLSNANVALAVFFLAWVLATGPAMFALELGTSGIGLMLAEFVRMNTWTDPLLETGFVEDWTVFYWAWWIAYGPFMGLFVTRISRGRTVRSVILGMIGFGTLGCALFYVIWGNSVMWMDMNTELGLPGPRPGGASGHGHRRRRRRRGGRSAAAADLPDPWSDLRRHDLRFGVLRHRRHRDPEPPSRLAPGARAPGVLGFHPGAPAGGAGRHRHAERGQVGDAGGVAADSGRVRPDGGLAAAIPARAVLTRPAQGGRRSGNDDGDENA